MEAKLIKTDCPMYRKQNAMFIKKKKILKDTGGR